MSDVGELPLGCLIHDLRSALGYSQGRLAERLCELGGETVTREMVSRWECGKRCPGPYWLRHLATALEVGHPQPSVAARAAARGRRSRRVVYHGGVGGGKAKMARAVR